jgi:hypothetical protein
LPSAEFSITIRIAVTADASSIGRLTTGVGEAGGGHRGTAVLRDRHAAAQAAGQSVLHDDQHGQAICALAALTNALRVVGKTWPMCGRSSRGRPRPMSAPKMLTGDDMARMADRSIMFAPANPDPKGDPRARPAARRGGHDRPFGSAGPHQQPAGVPGGFRWMPT